MIKKIAALLIFPAFFFIYSCKADIPVFSPELGRDEKPIVYKTIRLDKTDEKNIGYILYDPVMKKVMASLNRNKLFIPASLTKIPTTAAALKILGPGHRFQTTLAISGNIDNGIINGDLYLKGDGDPFLRITDLLEIINNLKNSGIKKITGTFYFDDSSLHKYDMTSRDMKNDASYNTGIGALSLDFNLMNARWDSSRKMKKTDIYLIPSLNIYKIKISEDKKMDEDKFAYQDMNDYGLWVLTGINNKNGNKKLPVKDPGLYTAHVFARLAGIQGITVPDPVFGILPEGCKTLYIHRGKPLVDIAEIILTYSNNLMAELVLLSTVKKITGKAMDLEEAGRTLSDFYVSKINNVNWEGFRLVNGSGLTGKNRISPEQMLALLLFADNGIYDGRSFISLLPISGWKGSLEGRMGNPESAFHVWAKTGGINFAVALSGLVMTNSKRPLLFAVFISDIDMRNSTESEGNSVLKDTIGKQAVPWSKKYNQVIDDLIKEWIVEY